MKAPMIHIYVWKAGGWTVLARDAFPGRWPGCWSRRRTPSPNGADLNGGAQRRSIGRSGLITFIRVRQGRPLGAALSRRRLRQHLADHFAAAQGERAAQRIADFRLRIVT